MFSGKLCATQNLELPCDHLVKYLTDLDFADDIALVSETVANAQILLQNFETAAATVSLTINQSKTKAMITGDITLKTRIIKTVDDFCYLRSWVAESNKDLNTPKTQAWTAMNKLSKIWKASQISRKLKIETSCF